MLISGGNFRPVQSVVKAPVQNHRSSDTRVDTWTAGKKKTKNNMGIKTSYVDLLDMVVYLAYWSACPHSRWRGFIWDRVTHSVSEIYTDFGHRLWSCIIYNIRYARWARGYLSVSAHCRRRTMTLDNRIIVIVLTRSTIVGGFWTPICISRSQMNRLYSIYQCVSYW